MAHSEHHHSFLVPIFLKTVLNIALVWVIQTYLPQYFLLEGGISATILVGILVSVLNFLVRPILNAILAPLRFLFAIAAFIAVNGVILSLIDQIVDKMDNTLIALEITGGMVGWAVVAIALGLGNWGMKLMFK